MLEEQYRKILKRERAEELIPFLKSLSKEDKKAFSQTLKAVVKEYFETNQVTASNSFSFKQKASPAQTKIIYATAFYCLNRKDYEKVDRFHNFLNNDIIVKEILPWYCPDWFSDIINNLTKDTWMPWTFRYEHAMDFMERGYLEPADELVVRLIPDMIFDRTEKHQHIFSPQNLVKREITCQKHIWLIFQYETSINHSDRYLSFEKGQEHDHRWLSTLKHYIDNGLLDRHRMLRESLLATNRNFNKTLSGWFVDLFEFLEPTLDELISLQSELLNVINAQNSKAVNASLNAFKKIADNKSFQIAGFLENTPLLLTSETKSVVSSSLTLLDKIMRKHESHRETICIAVCQALIHHDEDLQGKATKILLKYHGDSMSVREEIGKYEGSILMSTKKALAELIPKSGPVEEVEVEHNVSTEQNFVELEEITTLDQLIFLASQAFDNNDPMHFDLLPAALVNFQDKITGPDLVKFEPALQRAYKMVTGDWVSTMGNLDSLLATFFIDTTKLFISRFPQHGESLRNIHNDFLKKDKERGRWRRIPELQTWSTHSRENTYLLFKILVYQSYIKIKDNEQVPNLSTPTHQCGFIDPVVLVRRLAIHQRENLLPAQYDFQVAISRIAPFNHEQAVREARETLTGETLSIIKYLLTDANPIQPFTTKALWYMAAVTKSPHQIHPDFNGEFYSTLPKSLYTGDVEWKSFRESYKFNRYNFEKKKQEEITEHRNVLRLTINKPIAIWQDEVKKQDLLSRLVNFVFNKRPKEYPHIVHEYLSMKANYLSSEQNDIARIMYLLPSNPNPVLALVTHQGLAYSTFSSEMDKQLVTNTLEALINLKFNFSEITHLFIGSCMVTSDKTVRSFAAEIWINAVNNGSVDNAQLGKIIGIHLAAEYAPLKRLTDLIASTMLQISSNHNRAMEEIFTSMFLHMSDEPATGTKRLLELYSEILSVNNSAVKSDELKRKLEAWSSSASLKKTIASLM